MQFTCKSYRLLLTNRTTIHNDLALYPSNRQPNSCDLSSVVALDFNKLSGRICSILCYHVWSLEKRIFWERIIHIENTFIASTPTHVYNIKYVILCCVFVLFYFIIRRILIIYISISFLWNFFS